MLYFFEGWEVDVGRGELKSRGQLVPIGGRSLEIIEALVRSAGQIVTKDELMRRVWPGAIVEENTLHMHISAARKALRSDRSLLQTVAGQGYRMLGDWVRHEENTSIGSSPPKLLPASQTVTNLPLASKNLIGRSAALRDLRDLATAYRTVTLTGPGGIGKTALAVEAARQLAPNFSGDIRLIELVSISDPRFVPASVVGALNLKMGLEDLTAQAVARQIGDRRLHLVFDNCEHVTTAAAILVDTIIRVCPYVSIFATSRELLRIDGEFAYRVSPLLFPANDVQDFDAMLQHSAVELFITRIRSLQPAYTPRSEDIRSIATICRRLDGIPLAIEFAAARAATLGIDETLTSLHDMFNALTSGRRTAFPRHKTLRATLDWSYELLPAFEQRLLRSLSIFAGGFTLEAASAVSAEQEDQVSEGIANLVAKSLISHDQLGTDSRWRLLETTRSYAHEKLTEDGSEGIVARRHATYFRDLIGQKPKVTPLLGNFATYGKEVANVRAALDWAFSTKGDVSTGAVLTASYAPVWFFLSSMGECRQQVERALSNLDGDSTENSRLRMQLYIALGLVLAYTAALEDRTEIILTKALTIAQRLEDVGNQLLTLWSLWNLRLKNGDHRDGMLLAEDFTKASFRSDDPADVLVGQRLLGTSLHFRGKQPASRRHLEIVLDRYVAPTSERQSNLYLYDLRMITKAMLARVLFLQGFITQAEVHAHESLTISQDLGSNLSACYALRYSVCSVALLAGDLDKAETSIAMLIDLATKFNFGPFLKLGRYLEGVLLIKRGDFWVGTESLRAALDVNIKDGWSLCYPEALAVLAEGYAGLERYADAFAIIDRALEWSDLKGERWCDAELHRIKGELVLLQGRPSLDADHHFNRAVEIARHQGALFWELKASLSFARLRMSQGRPADARALIAPPYSRFTEGLDTAYLRTAREMLDTLAT